VILGLEAWPQPRGQNGRHWPWLHVRVGVSVCRDMAVEERGGKGRPKKAWIECVNKDSKDLKLNSKLATDRIIWR
jgi:hypothetical protein